MTINNKGSEDAGAVPATSTIYIGSALSQQEAQSLELLYSLPDPV